MTWLFPIVVVLLVTVGIVLFLRSARNFERRKIERGEWDGDGPLAPTDPPANFSPTALTGRRAIDVLNDISTDERESDGDEGDSLIPRLDK